MGRKYSKGLCIFKYLHSMSRTCILLTTDLWDDWLKLFHKNTDHLMFRLFLQMKERGKKWWYKSNINFLKQCHHQKVYISDQKPNVLFFIKMSTKRVFKTTDYFTQSQRKQFTGLDFFKMCFSGQQFYRKPQLQGKLSYNQMNLRNTGFNRGKLLFLLQDFWASFIYLCAAWHSQKRW